MSSIQAARAKFKLWKERPDIFVRDVFNVEPDAWQIEVLQAFSKCNRIAMKSSKGVGKSSVLAFCAWNFILTRPNPKMVATSISGENLADGLWAELSKWQQKSPLLKSQFTWTKTRIFANDYPETWFLSARTWAKNADASQQADTLAGIHADYVLFVLDEVGGIPDGVMAAAEAGLSSGIETKIIMAGNPTHTEGPLYRACTSERHLWHVTEITSDPDDPKRSSRVSIQWAREQIEKYGADNPYVLVNIFGKFPPSSLNALLGPDEVEAAMNRKPNEDDYIYAQKRLGIDVARFGDDRCFDDKTEILTNDGWKLFKDLIGSEKVFSIKGDKASWEDILHIHSAYWNGYLNLYEKRHLNFCITDNHRMFVRSNPKSKKYIFKSYQDLPKHFVLREENGWSGVSPSTKYFTCKKKMPNGGSHVRSYSFSMKDWACFLGWFVSEGNVYKEKRKFGRLRIIITQYPGKKRKEIERLLSSMGIKWRNLSNGTQLEFYNIEIAKFLIKNCGEKAKNKRVPLEIKNGSEEIIKAFLDSFLKGDGTCHKNGLGRTYTTSSKGLADDLQEMLAKLGRAGLLRKKNLAGSEFKIGSRVVKRRNDTYVLYEKSVFTGKWCKKSDVKRVRYKGTVWCVATKYESIFVRRNGVPMWSGNTVLFPRQGLMSFKPVEMRGARSNEIAARVALAKSRWGSEMEFVDGSGGYGSGVIDSLIQAGHGPIEVSFSGKAIDSRYFNKRAEMWFLMAEWVKRGGSLPPMPELKKELTAPLYTFQNGKFRLEEKQQIKDRLGYSPDLADALCLTFCLPEMPSNAGQHKKVPHDYDPFAQV